jgi:hypothetical protein
MVVLWKRIHDFHVFLFREEIHTADTFLCLDTGLNNYIAFVINDTLQLLGREAENIADFVRQTLEEPDMYYRNYEADMAHTFAAHLFLRYFHTTAIAYDTFISDTLILSAVALIVLYGTEDTFAEKTVALGFVRAIVNSFGLEHFAIAALKDFIGASQCQRYAVEALISFIAFLFERHIEKFRNDRNESLFSHLFRKEGCDVPFLPDTILFKFHIECESAEFVNQYIE